MESTHAYDTDVLVVGSGPMRRIRGPASGHLRRPHPAGHQVRLAGQHPRAHITNQRTMEVLRDLGVDAEAAAAGSPAELMGDTVLCTALAGEEIGRIRSWGTGPHAAAEYGAASPVQMIDLPQTYLEPILVKNAAERGAKVRFDTEFLSLEQDADGVTARLRDRLRGDEFTVRARYLIGADGSRSGVAEQIGLPIAGQSGKAGSMNITFKADLSRHVAHRPSVLYWVMRPGAHMGGIGMGLVRMVRPWNEWLLVWGYDIDQPPPEMDEATARDIVHDLIGDRDIPVEITSSSLWTVNHSYATTYSAGRVFCAGDAVHRHPPSNGLGSNTSIQDSYNLAWKLAMVIRGQAGPGLLDSYTAERAPVGKQIVDRANLSRDQFGPIFQALGLDEYSEEDDIAGGLAACRSETGDGAERRQALEEAIQLKNYEFNAHGVEMNQRYVSSAVVPDGDSRRGVGTGSGVVPPALDPARRETAARLARRRRRQPAVHAGHRRQGHLHRADRAVRWRVGDRGGRMRGHPGNSAEVRAHRLREQPRRLRRVAPGIGHGRGRLPARPPGRTHRLAVLPGTTGRLPRPAPSCSAH